jgi:hypothetical protein
MDAAGDLVVDEDAGEAADLEQVAAVGQTAGEVVELAAAHLVEVDGDAPGAGLGHDAVEGDDGDAGVAGFLDRAVERRRRGGVEDDGVVALQDHVLDLGGLFGRLVLGGGEGVGGGDDALLDGRAGDGGPAGEHRLAPGVAGVVVRERDALVGGVGCGGERQGGKRAACQKKRAKGHAVSLPRWPGSRAVARPRSFRRGSRQHEKSDRRAGTGKVAAAQTRCGDGQAFCGFPQDWRARACC